MTTSSLQTPLQDTPLHDPIRYQDALPTPCQDVSSCPPDRITPPIMIYTTAPVPWTSLEQLTFITADIHILNCIDLISDEFDKVCYFSFLHFKMVSRLTPFPPHTITTMFSSFAGSVPSSLSWGMVLP